MWDCYTDIIFQCVSEDKANEVYDSLSIYNWCKEEISLREFLTRMDMTFDDADDEYLGIIKFIDIDEKKITISVCTKHRPLVAMWFSIISKYWTGMISSFQYVSKNDKTRKYLSNMSSYTELYHIESEVGNEFFYGKPFKGEIKKTKLQRMIAEFLLNEDVYFEKTEISSLINELIYFDEKISIFPFEHVQSYTLI